VTKGVAENRGRRFYAATKTIHRAPLRQGTDVWKRRNSNEEGRNWANEDGAYKIAQEDVNRAAACSRVESLLPESRTRRAKTRPFL